MLLSLDSQTEVALVRSRQWLHLDKRYAPPSLEGLTLVFRLVSHTTVGFDGIASSVHVSGDVFSYDEVTSAERYIGKVYHDDEVEHAHNLVMDFLRRHGSPRELRQALEKPGWPEQEGSSVLLRAPAQSRSYSVASTDHNPIHVCPIFARFAGLDTPVVHGMNTSAIALRLVRSRLCLSSMLLAIGTDLSINLVAHCYWRPGPKPCPQMASHFPGCSLTR